jgi:hypothetical protein
MTAVEIESWALRTPRLAKSVITEPVFGLTFVQNSFLILRRISIDCTEINIAVIAELTGEKGKLHNKERHDLYSSPSIIRIIVNNIRMDLVQVGWGDVDWICLPQDKDRWRALVNSVLNLRVPQNARKLSSDLTTGGLSSGAQLHRVSLVNAEFLTRSCPFIKQSIGPSVTCST